MTKFEIPRIKGPEVFIGLVAPLGTDLRGARKELKGALLKVGYTSEIVRFSQLAKQLPKYDAKIEAGPEDKRIETLMEACDKLRREAESGAVLAHFAIAQVQAIRAHRLVSPGRSLPRTAFIFDSLKHPEEIRTLRRVYGDGFVAFAFYEQKAQRIKNLSRRIEKSHEGASGDWVKRAMALIERDESDAIDRFGQNVRHTFPQADFFARADNSEGKMALDVTRGVNLLFGEPFASPTLDEAMMFQARGMALRSTDLSRQVGAVIGTRELGQIAGGCNEVPRPGGGLYWSGDSPDRRDHRLGRDPNSVLKRQMLEEALGALQASGWLSQTRTADSATLANEALSEGVLKGLRVDSLIEFGRVVHAEMNALMEAAKTGRGVRGTTLYCTTFPCHGCARHIIASGVSRVVFVEPYPKSLVRELYADAVTVEGSSADEGAVCFEPFVGVAPRRFMQWFHRTKRKDPAGYSREWIQAEAEPVFDAYDEGYLEIEAAVCETLGLFIDEQKEASDAQG